MFTLFAGNFEYYGSRVEENTASLELTSTTAKAKVARATVTNTGTERWTGKKLLAVTCQRYLHL